MRDVPPLGRNTEATLDMWSHISTVMPRAPHWRTFRAPADPVDLTRFDPGYSVVDGKEDISTYFQSRGFCTGWALAGKFWFLSCMPETIGPKSRRGRAARTSPLYAYSLVRYGAKQAGVNLGSDDGGIVSYGVMMAAKYGMLLWSEMPCTAAAEMAWKNSRMPTAAELKLGATRAPATAALIDSRASLDQYLDGAYVADVGTDWTNGLANPDANGNIASPGGANLGGHSYLIWSAGYFPGTSTPRLGIKNSHPQYGVRSKSSLYAASDGWTNIAYVDRKKYLDTFFTDKKLSTGYSEAAIIAGPTGFIPRIDLAA